MEIKISSVGRPKNKLKTARLQIMINPQVKKTFKRIVELKGSNVSVKICELMTKYIEENEEGANHE